VPTNTEVELYLAPMGSLSLIDVGNMLFLFCTTTTRFMELENIDGFMDGM
jgi:hypothetical protein